MGKHGRGSKNQRSRSEPDAERGADVQRLRVNGLEKFSRCRPPIADIGADACGPLAVPARDKRKRNPDIHATGYVAEMTAYVTGVVVNRHVNRKHSRDRITRLSSEY